MAIVETNVDQYKRQVALDSTPKDVVLEILESGVRQRLYNPLEDPSASRKLLNWRQSQATDRPTTVAFTSGVFDVLHANHRAYLLNTKIAAAGRHYERYYQDEVVPTWENLRPYIRLELLKQFLLQEELKLIVSVDGNQAVAARKGFNPTKGNCERPVYDWSTRARDVSNSTYPLTGKYLPIADVITIHDNVQPEFQHTPHGDIMDIAAYLQPDVWSIYYESEDILEAFPADDRFTQTQGVRLEGHDFYTDRLLGGGFSTTKLSQRLLGSTALAPHAINGTNT